MAHHTANQNKTVAFVPTSLRVPRNSKLCFEVNPDVAIVFLGRFEKPFYKDPRTAHRYHQE